MVKKQFLLMILTVTFGSCGTLGHIKFYEFNASKSTVESALYNLTNKDARLFQSGTWPDYKTGADSLRDIFVFFDAPPSEIYQVGFAFKERWATSSKCTLALVGKYDGLYWNFESDLNSQELNRMEQRFEKEILSKLGMTYTVID